jgi:hypothetical protein
MARQFSEVKDMSSSSSFDADIKASFAHSGFNDDAKNFAHCRSTLACRLGG